LGNFDEHGLINQQKNVYEDLWWSGSRGYRPDTTAHLKLQRPSAVLVIFTCRDTADIVRDERVIAISDTALLLARTPAAIRIGNT
jgi:hypothetical protein